MTGVQDSYFKFHFITFKSDFPDSNTLRMVKLDQLISTVVHDELAEYDDLIISRVLSGEHEGSINFTETPIDTPFRSLYDFGHKTIKVHLRGREKVPK